MAAIQVDKEVFEALKQAYAEQFGSSPKSLITKLNQVYKEELDDPRDDLISARTIRGFFNADKLPKMQEKNLNYLCNILLKKKSYREALRQLIKIETTENELGDDWLEPYWKHLKRKCSTMRVLDMNEAVDINNIYVKFNISKDIKGQKQHTIEKLLNELELNKDKSPKRLAFSNDENLISGSEAVKHYKKLIVWGKPGGGKTTFLKYLAINSNLEESVNKLIPVFISLKEFVESDSNHKLINAIINEFKFIPNSEAIIQSLLRKGEFLIMLDGLDEVKLDDNRIYQEIESLTTSYPDNNFIVTCRTGTTDYVFKDFTEVEAADFGWDQIKKFVYKWFTERGEGKVAQKFIKKLETNEYVKELATNPLLLTILCCIFDDSYDFTNSRYELYADAVDSFLRRWDASRRIDRNLYLKLPRQRKIAMLSEIAYDGLNHKPKKILWKEWELRDKMINFLKSISVEAEIHKVLKEIEAYYGLIIKRAKGIYSFSHLTFQEYFAAEYIVENREIVYLNQFVEENLTKRRWRQVFVLIIERLNKAKADEFLILMFKRTNEIVKNNQLLQDMLAWLDRITENSGVASSSWRAFYLAIDLDVDLYISHEIDIDRIPAGKLSTDMRSFNMKRKKLTPATEKTKLISGLAGILALAVGSYTEEYNGSQIPQKASDFTKERFKFYQPQNISENFILAINKAKQIGYVDLATDLEEAKKSIPETTFERIEWRDWAEKLRLIMLEHLDIGHKVHFDKVDSKILGDYIYANNLLLECIQVESYSSKGLRDEVFNNLLLPTHKISANLLTS
ncbi:NACHT domain-containing protein [Mastigocoleus sp. MO_188.B34]|uniref:NACHT domain-containing protein n=1 Tax=Mastigocoleus sp. MO_188.B34 TaxID=3036635 RepID=UPI0026291784|nr:NACHT domain-containing protein [Mastigocoleus sp. MO_188.B34]MDJ0694482.1 NACHT domain-containing protein [Mastigocoleus sp. MO_188.B34]